jgi:hypothetical protein
MLALSSAHVALRQKSKLAVGPGQYRNAVASGEALNCNNYLLLIHSGDPTLPRYGTDPVQERLLRQSLRMLLESGADVNAQGETAHNSSLSIF